MECMLDIYILDDDDEYPKLQKVIYIGKVGQVTTLNGRSPSGGPREPLIS
jgi:hypothetical protein